MNMRTILIGASFALVASTQAEAAFLYAQAGTSVGNEYFTQSGVVGSVSISGSETAFGSTGSYSAFTSYGINKVSGSVVSSQFNDTAGGGSDWGDELYLSTGGQSGFVTLKLFYSATLTADAAPFRTASGAFSYIFSAVTSAYPGDSVAGAATTDGLFVGGNSVTVQFDSDSPIFIRSTISCNAQAQGLANSPPISAASHATCNAGNSVYWDGIVDVVDLAGAPITGWSATSTSGTDYSRSFVPQAVPEPATWALLIGGFGVVGAQLREQRKRGSSRTTA